MTATAICKVVDCDRPVTAECVGPFCPMCELREWARFIRGSKLRGFADESVEVR